MIKVLLEAGADPNARKNDRMTPLMHAAANNENPEVIKVLLEAGANLNAKAINGWTPIMFARNYKSSETKGEIIRLLKAASTR